MSEEEEEKERPEFGSFVVRAELKAEEDASIAEQLEFG